MSYYKVVATIEIPDTKALAKTLTNEIGYPPPNLVELKDGRCRLTWEVSCYWVADRILQECRKVRGADVTME